MGTPDQNAVASFTSNKGKTLDSQDIASVLGAAMMEYQAKLRSGMANPSGNFVKIGPFDLTTAPLNPMKLPSPFNSIILKDTTDDTVVVKLAINSDANFALDSAYPLDHNHSLNFEDPVPQAYLTWAAQPGKTATLYVGIGVEIRSGKIISVSSGGVSISTGSGMTPSACKSISTVALIAAADSTRKNLVITNLSGDTLFVSGTNTVKTATAAVASTTLVGIPIPTGASFEFKGQGALYGIADTATLISIQTES